VTARVLPEAPFASLSDYLAAGGGKALDAARQVEPVALIDEVEASGLRGRGGAGFPAGKKWRTIASYASPVLPSTVVVNAAEGEPGTYKDREILLRNPYAVLEGALIAALAVAADSVIVATKATFTSVAVRVRAAMAEVVEAGWAPSAMLQLVEGPSEYLFGEETALLEVVDGRPPLPRLAPPWRRGVVEVVETDADAVADSGLAAHVELGGTDEGSLAPPALAGNVETFANVPAIIELGADWFRSEGDADAPGTIVCTITGSTQRADVVEVPTGTTLAAVVDEVGGLEAGVQAKAVLVGVSNAVLPGTALDTPMTYAAMREAGSGLGSCGFIVLDDRVDMATVAAGVSRFLAVESCGQCTPCKEDGEAVSEALARVCRGQGSRADLDDVRRRLTTITDGARCNLATQHQLVVGSILDQFANEVDAHLDPHTAPAEPMLVAELESVSGGIARVDEAFRHKQYDWRYEDVDSGQAPADRLGEHRTHRPRIS
jgi:NADH:ubiquinone oxidoreductase subunit F (NADH-binding)